LTFEQAVRLQAIRFGATLPDAFPAPEPTPEPAPIGRSNKKQKLQQQGPAA